MSCIRYKFNIENKNSYLEQVYLAEPRISTQKQLAKQIGIHEKTLSRIFTGRSNLSVSTAKKIHEIMPSFEFLDLFIKVG